jgi:hypothetical protein
MMLPSRRAGAGRSRLLLEPAADGVDYPLLIGELLRFELGIDQFPVGSHFKAAPARGDQLDILDLLLVGTQQFARQTDGLRFVTSHGAIAQFQVHGISSPVL